MDVRITPEPEDRDAVLAAVEELLSRDPLPPAYRSIWRQRAIRENVEVLGGGYQGGRAVCSGGSSHLRFHEVT